ncbi:MAG: VOC family protein [Pseudomonadota bacterium]
MNPTPYLFFNGDCREALELYADVFDAKIEAMMTFAEMPPSEEYPIPDDRKDWIMHGAIQWSDGGMLMASDNAMANSDAMAGNSISMALPTVEAGREAFDRLSQGGEASMSYGPTFWTPGFGTVADRFGTRWMITTSAPFPDA